VNSFTGLRIESNDDCCADGRAHESAGFMGDGEFIHFFREYQRLTDCTPWFYLPVWATTRNVLSNEVFLNFKYHLFYFTSTFFVSILAVQAQYSYHGNGFLEIK
jgi:hypothetical protein